MIRSMTGFGRAKMEINGLDITVEIKSVNHRYFEFSCRMPRVYSFLEEKIKSRLATSISRGKVEVGLLIDDNTENATLIEIDCEYASAYIAALKKLSKDFGLKNDVKTSSLVGNTDIINEMIENDRKTLRYTGLSNFLRG